jgi:hypothetical protein
MRPKFIPSYVREDGTFCVVTKFKITSDAANLRHPVTEWCNQWVAANEKMKPLMFDNTGEEDESQYWHYYFAIFKSPPYVIKAEADQLWLRLDGTYSYWWRDWFVQLMGDLTSAFPELKQENSEVSNNCDE